MGTINLLDVIVPTDTNLETKLKNCVKIYKIKGDFMKKRKKLSYKGSKKLFKKTVSKTHRFNRPKMLVRGGYRL